jgi:dienelactone hydrolase
MPVVPPASAAADFAPKRCGQNVLHFEADVAGLSFCKQRSTAVCEVLESHDGLTQSLLDGTFVATDDVRDLFVVHPGNPGVVHFYDDFARALAFRRQGLAVIVLGFGGHTVEGLNDGRVYDLQDQVEIADAFFRRAVVSKNATQPRLETPFRHVFVSGHSIGAHLALHMTARFDFVTRGVLLTPTVMNMQQSPNGSSKAALLAAPCIQFISNAVVPALRALPAAAKSLLVRKAEPHMTARHAAVVKAMPQPHLVRNVLCLASTEFAQIAGFDVPLVDSVADRLWGYFVHDDGWVPLADMGRFRAETPRVAVHLEHVRGVKHAWCCSEANAVADAVAEHVFSRA